MLKNIAIIGCGYWGKNLVRNFYELGFLYCISDDNLDQAERISKEYNVKNKSFDEILLDKEVNAVVLAVPAFLHASMAIKAMNAGKHVYVEKPIAMNEDEANEMISCSNNNNVHLMVGHLLQYHPIFVRLKEIVLDGEIGKIKYIYSNRLSLGKIRTEENIIWSFAPHDISMILSLTEEMPNKVYAKKSKIISDKIADSALIQMSFNNGINAHINVSWINPFKEHKLTVIGTTGMLVFDDTLDWNNKLILYRHEISMNEVPTSIKKGEGNYIKINEAEPLKEECRYFVNLINGKVPSITDGKEGLRVLQVLSMADSYKEDSNLDTNNEEKL